MYVVGLVYPIEDYFLLLSLFLSFWVIGYVPHLYKQTLLN